MTTGRDGHRHSRRGGLRLGATALRQTRIRPPRGGQPVVKEAAALLGLLALLGMILGWLGTQPPARVSFELGAEPNGVLLDGFYGVEQRPGGSYRWARPHAWLSVPVDGPAQYRVTLVMQDTATAPSDRLVNVRVNGEPAPPAVLTTTPRAYSFLFTAEPGWGVTRDLGRLEVTLDTGGYAPPGDNRQLGPLVSRVTVEPGGAGSPWRPNLLLPNLLLLAGVYASLRLTGASAIVAGLAGACFVGGFGALAVMMPATARLLGYAAVNSSAGFMGTLAALAALPVVARLPEYWERRRRGRSSGFRARQAAPAAQTTSGATAARPAHSLAREGLLWSLGLFVALRVAFSLLGYVVTTLVRPLPPCDFERTARLWTAYPPLHENGAAFHLLGVWQRWDACWYEHIAVSGYLLGESSTAFFPLYPLLMRVAGWLFGGDPTAGGLFVSSAAFVVAGVGLYRLVGSDFDRETARRALVYLALFPVSFFLFAPFTEALFLACAVWALGSARRGEWRVAAVAALLAGLTRTQGSLLLFPLAWEVARQWRGDHVASNRPPKWAGVVPLLPVLALVAFTLYGKLVAGASPFQAQASWRYTLHAPWTVVQLSWNYLRARGDAIEAFNLACFAGAVGILALGARRIPASYTLFTAPQLILIGTRASLSPLMSTSRFVLVLFPLFVILALGANQRPWRHHWLAGSVLLLVILTAAFVTAKFVA